MENIQKSYYAIIPANVRYDTELPANAKLLYGEITALCNERGYCWATNDYFASLYNVSKTSISKWISKLQERGYISCELIYKEGTKHILHRYITIVNEPIKEKLQTYATKVNDPIKEKFKDNITTNITKNNTNNKKIIIEAPPFYNWLEDC
jgi:predicted transcriptional regulator